LPTAAIKINVFDRELQEIIKKNLKADEWVPARVPRLAIIYLWLH